MKLLQTLGLFAGLLTMVNAWTETAAYWTTVVTTAYTTYCPPTAITTTVYCDEDPSYTATGTGGSGLTITSTDPKVFPTHGSHSTVIIYTPPATTYISGTTPVTASHSPTYVFGTGSYSAHNPNKTPVGPSPPHPITVPTGAAAKVGPVSLVGLAAVVLAAMILQVAVISDALLLDRHGGEPNNNASNDGGY
ncbi:hypothetical protein LQW54_006508 [Pestalotiopsis sp. IQ-011]